MHYLKIEFNIGYHISGYRGVGVDSGKPTLISLDKFDKVKGQDGLAISGNDVQGLIEFDDSTKELPVSSNGSMSVVNFFIYLNKLI